MSTPAAALCPRCAASRVEGPECPRCGVLYARARPRAPELHEPEVPVGSLPAPTPVWDGEAEAQRVELWVRLFALPAALLLALLLVRTQMGQALVRIFFSMWVHELGHAVTAWFCGFPAVPGPWRTSIAEARSFAPALLLAAGFGSLGWKAWRARHRAAMAVAALGLGLQAVGTLALGKEAAQVLILFGGDAGNLVLGSLLMATLYAPEHGRLRTGALRWGFLVIGACAFMDKAELWWMARANPDRILYGLQEGVGLSDPSRLTEDHGWLEGALVGRYVTLSVVCLAALALLYAWGLVQQRRRLH